MIVVDTSAWVEFLRSSGTPYSDAVRTLVLSNEAVVPDVVRLELLAGAGTEEQAQTLARLLARGVAATSLTQDYDLAAELFRRARRAGTTVRSLPDCLIAAVCLRLELPLLARDRDFDALSDVSTLVVLSHL